MKSVDFIYLFIIGTFIIGGCLLNAAAINQEWWVDTPVEECPTPEAI